ncbi:hypothetical protein [Blastopirellula retiformator]|uniref:Uncharacterized protein n=1 Tax=Blastopirellula retiformator TaxID=2527970 RepID=A0A5C5VAE1_9BACT|nr:hypothetical protein [Blastopirellula retiformator]TWT34682.1 hypothetical protein Enr8_20950 [Blastopirellula retiformator]
MSSTHTLPPSPSRSSAMALVRLPCQLRHCGACATMRVCPFAIDRPQDDYAQQPEADTCCAAATDSEPNYR